MSSVEFNVVERFDLAPHPEKGEQFAMIERRPTREQMKAVERGVRRELNSGRGMDAEDQLVVALTREWQVYDGRGDVVPLRTGPAMDRVPADTLQPLIDELNAVVAAVNRGNALRETSAVLRNMAFALDPEKASRLTDLVDEVHGLFGVTPPNRETQAAS